MLHLTSVPAGFKYKIALTSYIFTCCMIFKLICTSHCGMHGTGNGDWVGLVKCTERDKFLEDGLGIGLIFTTVKSSQVAFNKKK